MKKLLTKKNAVLFLLVLLLTSCATYKKRWLASNFDMSYRESHFSAFSS